MALCVHSKRKIISLSVNNFGLCKRCSPVVIADIKKRLNLIGENSTTMNKARNIKDILMHCDLIIRHCEKLYEYENTGVPIGNSVPSKELNKFKYFREKTALK